MERYHPGGIARHLVVLDAHPAKGRRPRRHQPRDDGGTIQRACARQVCPIRRLPQWWRRRGRGHEPTEVVAPTQDVAAAVPATQAASPPTTTAPPVARHPTGPPTVSHRAVTAAAALAVPPQSAPHLPLLPHLPPAPLPGEGAEKTRPKRPPTCRPSPHRRESGPCQLLTCVAPLDEQAAPQRLHLLRHADAWHSPPLRPRAATVARVVMKTVAARVRPWGKTKMPVALGPPLPRRPHGLRCRDRRARRRRHRWPRGQVQRRQRQCPPHRQRQHSPPPPLRDGGARPDRGGPLRALLETAQPLRCKRGRRGGAAAMGRQPQSRCRGPAHSGRSRGESTPASERQQHARGVARPRTPPQTRGSARAWLPSQYRHTAA